MKSFKSLRVSWRQKAEAVTAITAIIATMLVPGVASAAQITTRSATGASSAPSASTAYSFKFTPGTAGAVKSIRFQICTSPLSTTACTAPTGGSMAAATAGSQSGGGITNQYTTTSYVAATDVLFANATGNTLTVTPITFPVNAITNPSTANQSFYFRVTTYSDAAGTVPVDFGAIAESTTQSLTVAANVQESLTFCVGTSGSTCGTIAGSTVNVGTGADNILSSTTPSGATSLMHIATNASTGYVITYLAGNFASGANNFATNAAGSTFAAGTELFGINVAANTTPAIGAAPSGTGGYVAPTIPAAYSTANTYAFAPAATTTIATEATGPTVQTDYTVSYAAQAGNTTKPGAYQTVFNYVATGTF